MIFSATAFICLYNEADIIGWVLRHLHDQGVGVHIIDNWSTDGSAEIAREFPLVGYERFPVEGPSPYYSWQPLLRRVEELAFTCDTDWCIHHDADEIRRSSRKGESLLDGFSRLDAQRYTAVNHQVFHFLPTDDSYVGDPENHFRYYTLDHGDCQMRQVKAWKRTNYRVDLASNGGHYAGFHGIEVAPEKFVLKHYPLRTSEQAARKVLTERVGRYDPRERAMDWHVQYLGIAKTQSWLSRREDLTEWTEEIPTGTLQNSIQFA